MTTVAMLVFAADTAHVEADEQVLDVPVLDAPTRWKPLEHPVLRSVAITVGIVVGVFALIELAVLLFKIAWAMDWA